VSALPAGPAETIPRPPIVESAAERLRAASLPVADLTTAFCALVI
jgi:hypothetical protein